MAAAAAPAIRVLKGADQQTTYASAFAAPLTVWVTDPVAQQSLVGVRVNFTAGPGIGLSASYAVTDEHGLAAIIATGLSAGVSSVKAEVAGFPSSQASFGDLIVNKAVLTVVPADLAAASGDKLPAISLYTIQGFVNGDTEATAQITGDPVLTTTAKDNSPHANYAIKGGVGTLSSPNYTFVAGFGTLAVSGSANGSLDPAQAAEAALDAGAEPASVRPALMNKPVSVSLREPAFLAGLRGQSGIFVQTAISAAPAVLHSAVLNSQVRNAALPQAAAIASPASTAPVRAAVSAKAAALVSPANTAPVHAAVLAKATAPAAPAILTSVRTAVTTPAASASVTSPYASSSIHTALIVPGTK
jgi:hypothetical protein